MAQAGACMSKMASPRRLDLLFSATAESLLSKAWVAGLPFISLFVAYSRIIPSNKIIPLPHLKHRDRARIINPGRTSSHSQLDRVAMAMQEPFLALTLLRLTLTRHQAVPILPDGFLGESARIYGKSI